MGRGKELGVHLIGVLFLKEGCAGILIDGARCIALNNHCYF